MPTNPLTGDWDAAVQVAVRQLDALLGTLHQNGARDDAVLKLLHGVRIRVGEVRRRPPDVGAFGDWVVGYERARPAGPRQPVRDLLVEGAPPGVAARAAAAFGDFATVIEPPPPDVVRGTAEVQLGTVSLAVAPGSTAEVTVRAGVRARYLPDKGTAALPEAVHGEVRIAYEVRQETVGGKPRLRIRPSAQDAKIEFVAAPGSGLGGTDAGRIATAIRRIVREEIAMPPVDLPADFPFTGFAGVGSGDGAAVSLPLQLAGSPPPAGAAGATQSLVGSSGFAFAVRRQYVQGLLDVESIRQRIAARTLTLSVPTPLGSLRLVTYRLRFSAGPTLTFQAGAIEIAGRVEVETGTWWAPNGFVRFTQRLGLALGVAAQQVRLVALGDPVVDESWFIPHGVAFDVVRSEITRSLDDNQETVREVFARARTDFEGALRGFEASASARFMRIEVTADGIVVRGEISTAPRIPPVVHVGVTDAGRAFSAFGSWIPGGRIDRFHWSWVEYPPERPTVWSGVARSETETRRFWLEKPAGIGEISQICLRVFGERVQPDGSTRGVGAGALCQVAEPVLALDVPSWWEPVTLPVWMPDLAPGANLRDAIIAHVGVQTDRPSREPRPNTLVFFPDWNGDGPFEPLVRGLEAMRRRDAALAIVVVLPAGAFDTTRRELEARFRDLPAQIAARIQVTEDDRGGWSRTFGVEAVPSLSLIDGFRKFVWKAERGIDPAELAAALDSKLVPAPGARFRPLPVLFAAGDRAPDVQFRDDGGEEGALHRLRGRPVLFSFWQSWSAPCFAELRRLQQVRDADRTGATQVVAFHGGTDPGGLDPIRKELGLRFPLVPDPEHRVARAFGVRCWPTTFAITPDGRIDHVQLGRDRDFDRDFDREARE
jgi:peroxiredoxin